MSYQDFDFIGFTYNNMHSYRDLGIYRTSNGDRYEETLAPTLKEKTATVDGMTGLYFLGTDVQQKQFNIPFAFQGLSEKQLRQLKQVFNGDGVHDLIFDENPYKVYSAKVTGQATMKYVCFDGDFGRKYNGEGNIQFTCYYPYAHTPKSIKNTGTVTQISFRYNKAIKENGTIFYEFASTNPQIIPCELFCLTGESIQIGLPDKIMLKKIVINCEIGNNQYQVTASEFSSSTLSINIPPFEGTGKLTRIKSLEFHYQAELSPGTIGTTANYVTKEFQPLLVKSGFIYKYAVGENGIAGFKADSANPFGRALNFYSIIDYPTKIEWAEASGLPVWSYNRLNNIGDVAAPFILTASGVIPKGSVFSVGGLKITTDLECSNLTWDGKTGLVTGTVGSSTGPIPFLGTSCGSIPVGEVTYSGKKPDNSNISVVLDYDYWYY